MAPILLSNERSISATRNRKRCQWAEQLKTLPIEFLGRMRHFQPQIGCPNACSICSQQVYPTMQEFSEVDVIDIVAAIKHVALDLARQEGRMIDSGSGEIIPGEGLISYATSHPGIVYLYLDNDPAFYPHLSLLVSLLYQELGVRSRLSTSGFSRNDEVATRNFQILGYRPEMISGIRLSLTPYIHGFSDSSNTSRRQFVADLAHTIRTLKSFLLNPENNDSVIELRFPPLVLISDFKRVETDGHYGLCCGGYMVVTKHNFFNAPVAKITSIDHRVTLDSPPIPGKLCKIELHENPAKVMKAMINGARAADPAGIHRLENADGEYFGVNIDRGSDGSIYSKYFYPQTPLRPKSGCIDAERYLLNDMLKVKPQEAGSWHHVRRRLLGMAEKAKDMGVTGQYICNKVLPLAIAYAEALEMAGMEPRCFYDRHFTVETGHICNLGFGYHEYRYIASRKDMPLTPHHERAFGLNGDLAQEGVVYRLAPGHVQRCSSLSASRTEFSAQCITVEQLDLAKTCLPEGQSLATWHLPANHILERSSQIIPGQVIEHSSLDPAIVSETFHPLASYEPTI